MTPCAAYAQLLKSLCIVVISEPFLRLVWVFGLDRLLQRRIARCRKQV